MVKLIENSESQTVSENFLTIPAKPASVIPEVPAQEIKLPIFLKKKESTKEFIRIDATGKFINVWMNTYNCRISASDYGDYTAGDVTEFISFPERFEIITEGQFNEVFATAHTAIATAMGLLVTVSRPPEPEDFNDTDYGEDDDRRRDVWMSDNEISQLNGDDL